MKNLSRREFQRQRTCVQKLLFIDRAQAERAALRRSLRKHELFVVYICRFCNGYHFGHANHHRQNAEAAS